MKVVKRTHSEKFVMLALICIIAVSTGAILDYYTQTSQREVDHATPAQLAMSFLLRRINGADSSLSSTVLDIPLVPTSCATRSDQTCTLVSPNTLSLNRSASHGRDCYGRLLPGLNDGFQEYFTLVTDHFWIEEVEGTSWLACSTTMHDPLDSAISTTSSKHLVIPNINQIDIQYGRPDSDNLVHFNTVDDHTAQRPTLAVRISLVTSVPNDSYTSMPQKLTQTVVLDSQTTLYASR